MSRPSIHEKATLLRDAVFAAGLLFWIGPTRSYLAKKSIFSGGLEMLTIGGIAAIIAYFVGLLLGKYVIV